jgi:hypothetical protein
LDQRSEQYRSPMERLIQQFIDWELRGRGIAFYNQPVNPEPPFEPFGFHDAGEPRGMALDPPPPLLSHWLDTCFGLFEAPKPPPVLPKPPPIPPQPVFLPEEKIDPVELQIIVPDDLDIRKDLSEQFLLSIAHAQKLLAFELLGLPEEIRVQLAASPEDADHVEQQLKAHFPDVMIARRECSLFLEMIRLNDAEWSIGEYALSREFMRPLKSVSGFSPDPLTTFAGALANLRDGELGLLQILFAPARHAWADSIWRAVTVEDGKPFIDDELVKQARRKIENPLYGVVIRTIALSRHQDRAVAIHRGIAAALGLLSDPSSNELICYPAPKYEVVSFFFDVVFRRARRSGMLLNSDELLSLAHLPSRSVQTPKLVRQTVKAKRAPKVVTNNEGLILGDNVCSGETVRVVLTPEQRVRHLHVMGTSGTGKSTFLFNLIKQDIENGAGVAVLDPHGDLVDKLLGIVPHERIEDVVLLDPSDEEYSVGFNILSAHSELEKNLLSSDLVSVFQRLSGSWGDQMASVLNNAILAFLESSQGGTLADLRRFLLEPGYRESFLRTVRDPDVVYYWRKGFAHLSGNKSIGPVLTRLETFLSRKPVRYMVSQHENRLDFGNILDTGKVFLAKLAQGVIGRENSYLLGTLLVSKLQQLAMSRQRQSEGTRRDFWIYIDEFHNFITPSMAEILSGARKYRIGLALAHQELRQLQRDSEVASSVLSNPGTRVCFKVGDDDAKKLAEGFSFFEAKDLQNLSIGHAICRVERSDYDFNLSIPLPAETPESEATERRTEVIAASRRKYGARIADVEAKIYQDLHIEEAEVPKPAERPVVKEQKPPAVEQERPAPAAQLPAPVQLAQVQPAEPRPQPSEPKSLGRGGPQHVYLQHLIEQLAISMNFEVEVEKTILEGEGAVDVALKRGDKRFAFEISATTGVEHEVTKTRKCFRANFDQVVLMCLDASRLAKLRAGATAQLAPEEMSRVRFCLPGDISSILIELSAASASKDTVSHGRKTKVTYRQLTETEARKRREILADVSTRSLKKLKGDT